MWSHRSPLTTYLKSRRWGGLLVSRWNIDKMWKSVVISLLRAQMCCQSGKLVWLHPDICLALQWEHTEAPWPIIKKVEAGVACQFRPEILIKCEKVWYYHGCVPKYVASWVNWSDCILTYAWNYNVTTQKPRDHLFKKSKMRWLSSFELKYWQNVKKCGIIIAVYPNMLPVG